MLEHLRKRVAELTQALQNCVHNHTHVLGQLTEAQLILKKAEEEAPAADESAAEPVDPPAA